LSWIGEEFPNVGVWTLGYASSPTKWTRCLGWIWKSKRDSGYSASLPQRALQVLDLMVQNGIGQRPLFFVCHSLCGLVVKHILRKAEDAINEEKKKRVATSTRAVLFLATPHFGAELASIADRFRSLFKTTISINELKEHDSHLEDIGNWYRSHSLNLGIHTATYYELRPLKGILPIVNSTSANPGVGADPIGLDEDHISIAKPGRKDDQVCNAARFLLHDYVLCAHPAVSPESKNGQDEIKINQSATASDKSVTVQNSPGTQVTISLSDDVTTKYSDQNSQLIDIVQEQMKVISHLTRQSGKQPNIMYPPKEVQKDNINYIEFEGQTSGNNYAVPQMIRKMEGETFNEDSTIPPERLSAAFIREIVQKLETTDDMVAEIHTQLSLWNYDTALLLSNKLEDQLTDIDVSTCPKLPQHHFLIARVHMICAEKTENESDAHIHRAKNFLSQIDAHLISRPDTQLAANVNALRGSIENFERGPEAALKYLSDCDDPYAIRIRIAMHLQKQEVDLAIQLIEGIPLHLRWCDLAVTAYAGIGRRGDALKITEWVSLQEDTSKYPQCVIRLADAYLAHTLSGFEQGRIIVPQDLTGPEQKAILDVLKDLNPVLAPIVKGGSVNSERETVAIKIAWQAHHLLGNREDIKLLARLMASCRPIPTDVARSVMSGYISPPPDLPKRLREDHPDDFDAKILAVVVESHMGNHETAYTNAKKLLQFADTEVKKEELFKLLQEIWQELKGDDVVECENIARPLIEHNSQLKAMFDAMRALRLGKSDLALEALDRQKSKDDIIWLQLRGNALMQKGLLSEAVEMFQVAASRTGSSMLLHKTADLAFQTEKVAVAIKCYEQLIEAEPDNLIARSNLASLYTFHLKDIKKATIQFRALHDAEPDNLEHTIDLAYCLAQLYRVEESLILYDMACNVQNPNLRAVLGHAELQLSLGNPDKACALLLQFRDIFWDSPDFLLALMNTSYSAGDDELAHKALCKLTELRSTGSVDDNAFKIVHTDEALEIFKEFIKAAEERNRFVHKEMVNGRMPWVWVAQLSSNAVYWAWRLRTLELDWIGDDPINRANYTIYSTNGFHAGKTEDGRCALLRLECPPANTTVTADLSALITLHRLELLEIAADYFGEILIPQAYLSTVLEDGKKMVLHQRSRKRTAEEISTGLVSGKISMIDQKDFKENILPVVDEYQESEGHRYHLIDVIKPIHKAGLLDDVTFNRVKKVCTKSSGIDSDHPPFTRLQNIHIELSTLETISLFGLLVIVTKFYRVQIMNQDQVEMRRRLEALSIQEETRLWHFELWDLIRANHRFRFVQPVIPKEMREKDTDDREDLAFLAYYVAQYEGVPLLADDRTCQAMMLNKQENISHSAFGTDAFVSALSESGKLDISDTAEAIFHLVQWRYRFIMPSSATLKKLAANYRENPPGLPLREVAEYVHDCMRDAGLFGGQEKTDANESMAMRLYVSWVNLLANWLVDLWSDEEFPENTTNQLTEWCAKEFFPSQPRVFHGNVKVKFSSLTPRLLISHMLLRAHSVKNGKCVSDAIQAIQKAMVINDEDYLRIITETLNDTRKI